MGFNTPNPVNLLFSQTGQGAGTYFAPQNGADGALDGSPFLAVLIELTAGTTPSLTPTIQWSHDGQSWFDGDPADTMTVINAVGKKAKSFTRKAPFHRVQVVVAGTNVGWTVRAWCFGA